MTKSKRGTPKGDGTRLVRKVENQRKRLTQPRPQPAREAGIHPSAAIDPRASISASASERTQLAVQARQFIGPLLRHQMGPVKFDVGFTNQTCIGSDLARLSP